MNTFIEGVFFGIIGSGYVMYARRAHDGIALAAGVALCVFPYFVDGAVVTLAIGGALVAVPFVLRGR